MLRARLFRRKILGLAVACALVGLGVSHALELEQDLTTPRTLRSAEYVGAAACRRCHDDHYASWYRTYHRSMTQEANAQTVLGRFDGRRVDYLGVSTQLAREGEDFVMRFARDGGLTRTNVKVERTVGSHRFQQYLARDGDSYVRLPIAWDVAAQRFIHMNGAFLTPDPEEPAEGAQVSRADFERHVTRWNDNCIFCHNVGPNPGYDDVRDEWNSSVAELGIGCEACHGPGSLHVEHNRDPLRRYALHASTSGDPTIRNPARMNAERSAEVCGRCHGQRITDDVGRFLREGDPYIPGEPLSGYSRPLARDTPLRGDATAFALRFFADGTPRLTAYEYQGYLASPCTAGGKLSCETCHAMHDSDPKGQLRKDAQGDAACTSCHVQLAEPTAAARHAGHDFAGAGARCQACHMPDIVYGLRAVKLSHRIEVPDPAMASRTQRPDACTLCHVDRSRDWAIDALRTRETERFSRVTSEPAPGNAPFSEVEKSLLAGDPIERAIAAHALGKSTTHSDPRAEPRFLALLLDTLVEDPYPAVRAIGAQALAARAAVWQPAAAETLRSSYDATARRSQRRAFVDALRVQLAVPALAPHDKTLVAELRARAAHVAIAIGE